MAIVDGLITLADARKSIYGNTYATAPTTLDSDIEDYVEAATPVIENICGPVLVKTRTFTHDGGVTSILLPYAISSVTSVTENGVAITDYTADLTRGIIHAGTYDANREFESGLANIVITVVVGNATIPPNVILATRELVRFWWQLGRQANRPGVAEAGDAAPDLPMGFAVPRRVTELLRPNPRMAGFA